MLSKVECSICGDCQSLTLRGKRLRKGEKAENEGTKGVRGRQTG